MLVFTRKVIDVPVDSSPKTIDAVQLWNVRWTSRRGEYHFDTQPELEGFPTEEEALAFASALRAAFTLIKHTFGNRVTVTREK